MEQVKVEGVRIRTEDTGKLLACAVSEKIAEEIVKILNKEKEK